MISIVTGSARPGNVSEALAGAIYEFCVSKGLEVRVVNLRELDLPFVDSEFSPSHENFNIEDARVQHWSDVISASEKVVLLTPTYNRQPSAVIKNAVDWLYGEWQDKPVAIVGYGWSDEHFAEPILRQQVEFVKAKVETEPVKFKFMSEINPDGSIIDQAGFEDKIAQVLGL